MFLPALEANVTFGEGERKCSSKQQTEAITAINRGFNQPKGTSIYLKGGGPVFFSRFVAQQNFFLRHYLFSTKTTFFKA